MCTNVYMIVCKSMCTYVCMCAFVCMSECVRVYVYLCVCVCMSVCEHEACVCVHFFLSSIFDLLCMSGWALMRINKIEWKIYFDWFIL